MFASATSFLNRRSSSRRAAPRGCSPSTRRPRRLAARCACTRRRATTGTVTRGRRDDLEHGAVAHLVRHHAALVAQGTAPARAVATMRRCSPQRSTAAAAAAAEARPGAAAEPTPISATAAVSREHARSRVSGGSLLHRPGAVPWNIVRKRNRKRRESQGARGGRCARGRGVVGRTRAAAARRRASRKLAAPALEQSRKHDQRAREPLADRRFSPASDPGRVIRRTHKCAFHLASRKVERVLRGRPPRGPWFSGRPRDTHLARSVSRRGGRRGPKGPSRRSSRRARGGSGGAASVVESKNVPPLHHPPLFFSRRRFSLTSPAWQRLNGLRTATPPSLPRLITRRSVRPPTRRPG